MERCEEMGLTSQWLGSKKTLGMEEEGERRYHRCPRSGGESRRSERVRLRRWELPSFVWGVVLESIST